MSLFFSRCYSSASPLVKATSGSVGFDIKSFEHLILPVGKTVIVKTGIKVKPPEGTYVRIASRSGLASQGIIVHGGVIDPDYTGEIKIILHNCSDRHFIINKDMKIAQLIVEKAEFPELIEVEHIVDCSERGEKGFGSSGL
ncbi:probable deoxyuridine 5'-triphosphate nucleotidohydrolase [Tetranychus urticae]|uniref:Deoxyuridine 5'-triphosphate nucleotidohydrolase n=1 Tax=Tetranychus urticae TaxID=32264 RepID=T1KC06_TETUR|nr:probable deoxyuridine 5'-triphosphate nucleotidohydrolase [Tetranychus urticae]